MTQPNPADELDVIDLDAERSRRAAEREGKRKPLPIRVGGEVVATLPVELPLDVLAPLRSLDADLTLVLRSAMQAYRATDEDRRRDQTEMVIDVLAANPALPVTVLDTLAEVARNLLTPGGYDAFMASRPSGDDLAALAKGVFRFYGVSLGEPLPPSESRTTAGATSSTTSEPTSDSTPDTSGPTETTPTSSVSAAS